MRSGPSPKMSDHEPIAQVDHQKLANEGIARIFEQIANLLIFFAKNERYAQRTDERIPIPALRLIIKEL